MKNNNYATYTDMYFLFKSYINCAMVDYSEDIIYHFDDDYKKIYKENSGVDIKDIINSMTEEEIDLFSELAKNEGKTLEEYIYEILVD